VEAGSSTEKLAEELAAVEGEAAPAPSAVPEDDGVTAAAAQSVRRRQEVGGAVAALVALASAVVFASRASRVQLADGEQMVLSMRPRPGVWRYVRTLGFWELQRLATRYTITDRRLVLQNGLGERVTRVVPLNAIGSVVVRAGPVEGYVEVESRSGGRARRTSVGPLTTRRARRVAASILEAARQGGR